MKNLKFAVAVLLFGAAGCYTLSETEYPDVSVPPVPTGKHVSVKLTGFRSSFYSYQTVEGHETMIPGNADADSVMAQWANIDVGIRWDLANSASGRMALRSLNELKRKGYDIGKNREADYAIVFNFTGPEHPDWELSRMLGYAICTLFTAEKNEVTWRATLEVLDAKENVVFSKEYEQNYCTTVWGPIPVASPACHPMSTDRGANSWAITALSDRALVDATTFIVSQLK